MKKAQINMFIIMGIVIAAILGISVFAGMRINEKKADIRIEEISLSPGDIAPVKTFAENTLFSLSEDFIFNQVGNRLHDPLPGMDYLNDLIRTNIEANFHPRLDLSEFEEMEIKMNEIEQTTVKINQDDIMISIKDPWHIKIGDNKRTIDIFRANLFIRLKIVHEIASRLKQKAENFPTPYRLSRSDCQDISDKGGQDPSGSDYISAEFDQAQETITITDRYTEDFYFQKPFVFKFKEGNILDSSCP